MNKVLKLVIALFCLPLLALGIMVMFNPMRMVEQLAVEPIGAHGLNTIRGDVGGLLLGSAIMMAIGIWRGNATWLLASAVMMGAVAFGRLISFVVDGLDPAVIAPFVVEIVIVGIMLLASQRLAASRERSEQVSIG